MKNINNMINNNLLQIQIIMEFILYSPSKIIEDIALCPYMENNKKMSVIYYIKRYLKLTDINNLLSGDILKLKKENIKIKDENYKLKNENIILNEKYNNFSDNNDNLNFILLELNTKYNNLLNDYNLMNDKYNNLINENIFLQNFKDGFEEEFNKLYNKRNELKINNSSNNNDNPNSTLSELNINIDNEIKKQEDMINSSNKKRKFDDLI